MRDLCQTHKLVLAEDGKCVLCRRPAVKLFAVREEHETLISRVFTGLLGTCLALALGALIYVSRLDQGYSGGKYVAGPVALGHLSAQQQAQLQQALAEDKNEQDGSDGEADTQDGADTEAAAQPNESAQKVAVKLPAKRSAPPPSFARVQVTMYATPWCFICDRARDFLLARNVVLTEYDVDRDKDGAQRLAKANPSASLPTFEIEGRAYVGFNPWDLEDALRAAERAQADAPRTQADAPRTQADAPRAALNAAQAAPAARVPGPAPAR